MAYYTYIIIYGRISSHILVSVELDIHIHVIGGVHRIVRCGGLIYSLVPVVPFDLCDSLSRHMQPYVVSAHTWLYICALPPATKCL